MVDNSRILPFPGSPSEVAAELRKLADDIEHRRCIDAILITVGEDDGVVIWCSTDDTYRAAGIVERAKLLVLDIDVEDSDEGEDGKV